MLAIYSLTEINTTPENLNKYRTELVKKLSQLKYSKQIYTYWTSDGRIYVK
jgi:hypothetical protein